MMITMTIMMITMTIMMITMTMVTFENYNDDDDEKWSDQTLCKFLREETCWSSGYPISMMMRNHDAEW